MNKKCSICKLQFIEDSVQIHRRLKNNGPCICKDCSRIANAEKHAQKRKEDSEISPESRLMKDLAALEKQHGCITIPLLQRKYKWSYASASDVLENYQNRKISL